MTAPLSSLLIFVALIAVASAAMLPIDGRHIGKMDTAEEELLEKVETSVEGKFDSYSPTPAGIRNFVGIGYNIITGNPEGSDDLGGVDPGCLVNRHILALTYDENNYSPDGFILPDQVYNTIRDSVQTSQETFHGTQSYVNKVQSDITESREVSGIFQKVKFSASKRYSEVAATINAEHYVYYEEREVNLHAEARYRIELAESREWPLDEGFVAASCSALHPTYDEESYMEFIDLWGTHFITEVKLGTKSATRFEQNRQGFVHYAHSEVSHSVSFEANVKGFKGGVKVDMDTFNAGLQVGMKFGEEKYTYSAGGEDYPEPIGMSLSGMHEIFDNIYWMRSGEYVNAGLCEESWINNLEVIAYNMEQALNGYAIWKNAQESQDPVVRIPITWPKGTYGLPMADGAIPCPDMTSPNDTGSDLYWAGGWRYYDTEDSFSANEWSNPYHLKGPKYANNMYSNFCMKTVMEADIYDWKFPSGVYCVYKKGTCPFGLTEGYIYWDDEDTANDNQKDGELPDGTYDSNTRINYCCRTDGYASNEIYLPTDNPFFLMKYNHQCQQVHGMKYTEEWFKWDNQDVFNNDDAQGAHPYEGVIGGQNIKIHYCYYEPL